MITVKQSNAVTTTSNTNPISAAFTSGTVSGNSLVAVIQGNINTVTGVTDNFGNAWTLFRSLVNYTSSYSQYIYYCANAVGGAGHTLSIAMSSTGWNWYVGLHEFRGAARPTLIESASATTTYTSNASASLPSNGVALSTLTTNDYVLGIFDAQTGTTLTAAPNWAILSTGTATITLATVGMAQSQTASYTPQVLEAITGWPGFTWSVAIVAAPTASYLPRLRPAIFKPGIAR